jgi:hypothetical protein
MITTRIVTTDILFLSRGSRDLVTSPTPGRNSIGGGGQQGRHRERSDGHAARPAAGHTAKLVLLGSDDPYLRMRNDAAISVQVSDVTVTLPTVG